MCVCHKNDIMLYTALSIIVPSIYRCTHDDDDDGNNVINDNCILLYYIISYRINRTRTLMALDVHGTVSRQTITRGKRDNACARD